MSTTKAYTQALEYLRGCGRLQASVLDVNACIGRLRQVIESIEAGDENSARHFFVDALNHLSGHTGRRQDGDV